MIYRHDTKACPSGPLLDSYLARCGEAIAKLKEARETRALPHLTLPYEKADLVAARGFADTLRRSFADIVILGIGGSSLGAKAVTALAREKPPARLHFPENLDPETFSELLSSLDLKNTHFLVVSKSGGTAETLAQAFAAMSAARGAAGDGALGHNFSAIVEPGDNPLRRLATEWGWPIFDHDPNLGGRFSVLSIVGMMPALLAGLEPFEFRAGAAEVLDQALSGAAPSEVPAAVGAALAVALSSERGMSASVMLGYADRLEQFVMWHRQLWAESLGKNGKGLTPIMAIGPVDHHSQLQLYLDGPNDKVFTVFAPRLEGSGPRIDPALAHDPALSYLAGRTIGDLVAAQARATIETLAARGRPVRVFHFDTLDARTVGALMMHFMLETILAAHLLGVDPFDQPAVEEGKRLARAYLAETKR